MGVDDDLAAGLVGDRGAQRLIVVDEGGGGATWLLLGDHAVAVVIGRGDHQGSGCVGDAG